MLALYGHYKKEELAPHVAHGLGANRMADSLSDVQAAESGMRCNEAAKQTPFVTEHAA